MVESNGIPKSSGGQGDRNFKDLLASFARRQRVKLGSLADYESIVPGSRGHVFVFDAETLGVVFLMPGHPSQKPARPRLWAANKRRAADAGMVLCQDGDDEGSLTFDPTNPTQCALALRIAGIRRRRCLSSDHRFKLNLAGRASRYVSRGRGSSEGFHAAGLRSSPAVGLRVALDQSAQKLNDKQSVPRDDSATGSRRDGAKRNRVRASNRSLPVKTEARLI